MRIETAPNTKIELSYLDLLDALRKDIETDRMLPSSLRRKAITHVQTIQELLEPYTA